MDLDPERGWDYASTVGDVTLGSFLSSIVPRGRLSIYSRRHNKHVIGVQGTMDGLSHILFTHVKGKRLPIEDDEFAPRTRYSARTVMSKWNETVAVTAPDTSVPIATVRQS
jgi:hypothetical protein